MQKTISNSFSVNTVYDGKDGNNGKDGVSQPSYERYQEAWGNSAADHNDIVESDWSDSTPAKTKTYLWRRSCTMTLDTTTRQYVAGSWGNYVCLSGTNGTSIRTRGQVEDATKRGTGTATLVNGTTITMADGDAVTQLDNGHLYQWVTEGGGYWIDIGQFKGESGTTYYTHIAWGKNVTLSNNQLPVPTGQTNRPNATAVEYFSVSPVEGYNWMGFLVNETVSDPTSDDRLKYTWQDVKGDNAQFVTVKGACHIEDSAQVTNPNNGEIVICNGQNTVRLTQSDMRPDTVSNQRRGLALVLIDRYQMSVADAQNRASYDQRFFDTYGENESQRNARCNELARVINEDIGTNKFVCLFSYDAIGWNDTLINSMKSCGSWGIEYAEPARRPFAFIGYKGLDEGYAKQLFGEVESHSTADVTAYIADGAMSTTKNGRDGTDGKDGLYEKQEYAIYDSRNANSQTGAPTGNAGSSWSAVAPAPTGNFRYVWQRSRLWDPNTNNWAANTNWSYVCLTGGDGQQGLTGRMYYMAGEWDATKTYTRTSTLCPVVYYKVTSGSTIIEWWYLNVDESTNQVPVSGGSTWIAVTDFGVVLTEAIFVKEFAQFGSCIITGDWLISIHGKIGSTVYAGSVENPEQYNNRAAYTWFDPLYPSGRNISENILPKDSIRTNILKRVYGKFNGLSDTCKSVDYELFTDTYALRKNNNYAFTVNFKVNLSCYTGYVRIMLSTLPASNIHVSTNSVSGEEKSKSTGSLSADNTCYFAGLLEYKGGFSGYSAVYTYSANAHSDDYSIQQGYENPNKVPLYQWAYSKPAAPTNTGESATTPNNGWSFEYSGGTSGKTLYICFATKYITTAPTLTVSSIVLETSTNANRFVPNYAVDLKTGRTYQNDAYLRGQMSTMNDMVVVKEDNQTIGSGWINITDRGLFCRNDKDNPLGINEIIASIGVHKTYSGSYAYENGTIELRNRQKGSYNYSYASISGSGLAFALHERNSGGTDQITSQTNVSYEYVRTDEVKTNRVNGMTSSTYGLLPVAFPANVDINSTVTLPANPESGMIIFAPNCKIVKASHYVYMSNSSTLRYEDSVSSSGHVFNEQRPRIFVGFYYSGTFRWKEYDCV